MRRLVRRSFRRPFLTLGITLAIVSALVGRTMWRQTYYTTGTLRMTENPVERMTAPPVDGKVRGFVLDVAPSAKNLRALAEKYDLYPAERRLEREALATAFRKNVSIEVWRTSF